MKNIKRIIALLLVISVCMGSQTTVFAASEQKVTVSTNVASIRSATYPVENNYNNVWLNKGSYYGKSFRVYNTTAGKIGFTFQIESASNSSYATMYVTDPNGRVILTPVAFISPTTPKANREYILNNAKVGYYTIHYDAYAAAGMRINCWTYKWNN